MSFTAINLHLVRGFPGHMSDCQRVNPSKSLLLPHYLPLLSLLSFLSHIYIIIYIWSTIKFPLLVMTSYHLITIKSHKIPIFWWLNRSIHHFHRLSLWQAERSSFTEEETLVSFAENERWRAEGLHWDRRALRQSRWLRHPGATRGSWGCPTRIEV